MLLKSSWHALAFAATLALGSAQTQDPAPASRELTNTGQSVHQSIDYDGRTLFFEDVSGRAVVQGDIVLGPVTGLRQAAPKSTGKRDASIATNPAHRWPGGVVPYVIDEAYSYNPYLVDIVNAAIQHWEEATSFRFVPREDQTDYIRFIAQDYGCWTEVGSDWQPGMLSGEQLINLDWGCFTGQATHEIGHGVGFWHEQSRNDRDTFLQVRLDQVPPAAAPQFAKSGAGGLDDGYYDFASIMHYGSADFSIAGAPVLRSIPPGIPFGQTAGLSVGDIFAAERMLGKTIPYAITTNPPGLDVVVDGQWCPYPCIVKWANGSVHNLEAPSPQLGQSLSEAWYCPYPCLLTWPPEPTLPWPTLNPPTASKGPGLPSQTWYFGRWNDDGARVHQVTADPNHALIAADFTATDPKTLPDLAVTAATAPTTGAAGQVMTGIRADVRNIGGGKSGPFRVTFYISPRSAVTLDDVRLDGSCMYDQGLVAGTTVTCQVDPIIPETLAAGTYYVGAFADDMMQVGESNRKNNALVNQNGATSIISLASGLPNLEVVSFVAATKGVIGRALPQMRVEVRNRGGAPAGPFRIGYYVSKTPNIESDGLYTKWSCLVDSGLRPGESRVCSGSIQIRPDLEAGLYYLAAFVDDLRQVREGDETNNIRVNDLGQVQLEKPAPAPGNLLFPWQ
jgi:hypothetical protein